MFTGPAVPTALTLILVSTVLLGFAMARCWSTVSARVFGWTLFLVGTIGIERLCEQESPLLRMMALIAFALMAMKALFAVEATAQGMRPLSIGSWQRDPSVRRRAGELLKREALRIGVGLIALFLAKQTWQAFHSEILTTTLLLVGISLVQGGFSLCLSAKCVCARAPQTTRQKRIEARHLTRGL